MLYVINLITICSLSLVLCVSRRVAISMVVLCVYVCQFTYCFAFDYSAVFIYNIMTVFAVCMLGGWEQSARGVCYIFLIRLVFDAMTMMLCCGWVQFCWRVFAIFCIYLLIYVKCISLVRNSG